MLNAGSRYAAVLWKAQPNVFCACHAAPSLTNSTTGILLCARYASLGCRCRHHCREFAWERLLEGAPRLIVSNDSLPHTHFPPVKILIFVPRRRLSVLCQRSSLLNPANRQSLLLDFLSDIWHLSAYFILSHYTRDIKQLDHWSLHLCWSMHMRNSCISSHHLICFLCHRLISFIAI